jgi:hypothetical protein
MHIVHETPLFRCYVILLFVVGDYPGLGKIADFQHNGFCKCHWCVQPFTQYSPGHIIALNNVRWLPPNHHLRYNTDDGITKDTRPPPRSRKHATVVKTGMRISKMATGAPKTKEIKKTGIINCTLFAMLHMFDIVKDFLPDVMHILKGLWNAWFLLMMKNEKLMAAPTAPSATYNKDKKVTKYTDEEMVVRNEAYSVKKSRYAITMQVRCTHMVAIARIACTRMFTYVYFRACKRHYSKKHTVLCKIYIILYINTFFYA